MPCGIQHLLKSYKDRDRAPCPQVALPVVASQMAAATRLEATVPPREQATAHMIIMAFYCLLVRLGEYTLTPAHVTTRTVQHCVYRPPAMHSPSQPPPRL
jgi:hypothetical protein